MFWGQSSPEKATEVWHLIADGENSYTKLKDGGYRNAIEILTTTISIKRNGDRLIILKDLDEIMKTIDESDTICYVKEILNENEDIKSIEVGELLNQKFHRNWLRSSKIRYGNALLKWSRYLS